MKDHWIKNYDKLVREAQPYLRNLSDFGGEDAVQEAFFKAFDSVSSAEPAQLQDRIVAWTSYGYMRRAVLNACVDRLRKAERERGNLSEYFAVEGLDVIDARSPSGDSSGTILRPLTPEEYAGHLSAKARYSAIRAMIHALYERGSSTPRRQPFWTARHVETVRARFAPAPAGEGALSDEELEHLVKEERKRFKDRWDGGKAVDPEKPGRKTLRKTWSDPEAGTQSAAARTLGKSRAAVSKTSREAAEAIRLVQYVAGVLAPEHTLLDTQEILFHLNAYDHLDERAGTHGHAQRLESAAPAVRTTTDTGTRVQPAELGLPAGAALDQLVFDLHDAEQSLAEITGTPDPNCVLVCDTHTRRRDRVTEVHF